MPATLTQEQNKMISEAIFEKLASRNPTLEKEAVDAVNDFTRTKMREDGFFRKFMPPIPLSNDELDRTVHTDKPIKIVDKEPDSPAAISIGYGTLPMNIYIRGNRYVVTLDRITTPRFTKDVSELRTWIMDIRQVLSDNAIKDMLAEEDGKFITAVNTALVGMNVVVPTSGVVQWQQFGSISRDSLCDMLKIMPSTPSHLETHTCLVNNITIKDVWKFGRNEMGGDMAQDIMKDGWTYQKFLGKDWIITIKTDLVPNGYVYQFSDPKFIGKHYSMEDVTMFIRREAFMIEFYAYEEMGAALGHTSGLALAQFNA